jgi:predicted 2-oxoglutarate/Fe(II)-dependent dioxygenase YbiX/peroxiredoxin
MSPPDPHPAPPEPGQRLPDFSRRLGDGTVFRLYEAVLGQPLVVLVADRAEHLRPLAADVHHLQFHCPQTLVVAVTADRPEVLAEIAASGALRIPLLADDGSLISALRQQEGEVEALATDRNLRLLDRYRPSADTTWSDAVIGLHVQGDPMLRSRTLRLIAPVLMVPNVLAPEECRRLIDHFERSEPVDSPMPRLVGGRRLLAPDHRAKQRLDVSVEEPELDAFLAEALARRLLPEVRWAFGYRATRYERFKLVCYPAGAGHFRAHRDNLAAETAHRRFAITINLNTGDYRGGKLRFPEYGSDLYEPEPGGAIVFSGSLAHEVTDVTRGRRYALLSFLFDQPPGGTAENDHDSNA